MPQFETWTRYLPAPLRARLEGRPNLWRILTNIGWLFGDRILRLGVGLLIGVWVARYLGPEQFGLLNYALAFVGLFMPLAMLGLDNIVIRDLVHSPVRGNETLGTAFVLKLGAGIAAYGLALLIIITLKPETPLLHALVVLTGATLVFQAFDAIDFWFQAQVRSKYSVIARNASFLTAAVLRIVLILAAAPLVMFAAAVALEGLLAALGLVIVYRLGGHYLREWRSTRLCAAELLRMSWPLLFSGLAIAVYMKIDQIMLGEMLNEAEVGIYAAAVRISEVWYFIPGAVVGSVAPTIINAKKTDGTLYERRMQQLLGTMALLGYAVAIPVTLLARPMVWLLYGPDFAGAGAVLALHIWAGVFVCLGGAQHAWLITEGCTGFAMISTAVGALINVVLNWLLIPDYESVGAAIATLISYGTVVAVMPFLFRPAMILGRMTVKALLVRK